MYRQGLLQLHVSISMYSHYCHFNLLISLFRFGSFEIFKGADPLTGYRGPSAGRVDILRQLLAYTIDNFFPQVYKLQFIFYLFNN